MSNPTSATEKGSQLGTPNRRQLLILFIVSGAVLVLIALAILVYLGLRGARQPTLLPTPSAMVQPTATAFASPVPAPTCQTIISSGDVQLSVALPASLSVGSTTYPVEPIVPSGDAWTYPLDRSGRAVWVCGTVVNYVIGLEPTSENRDLMGGLSPGDEIEVQLTSGTVLRFRFAERRDTAPGAELAISQQEPRLTLVLPESDGWRIAAAGYASEGESMGTPPLEASAELGQSVPVDQARVTLTRGYIERSDALSAGTTYYVTEFSVENTGDAPIASDTIAVHLRDSMGNTYLASPRASELGESGPLSGELQPGTSVQASAGFVVPDPLPAGDLIWIFLLRAGSEEVRVGIPHKGGTDGEGVPVQPEVSIGDAFLDDSGTTLIIEGEVRNGGAGPLTVEPGDVTLSSSAGTSELVMTAPPLPWTIQPGQSQVIELQYQRPNASTVLLELLGYSFEIAGLQ